jgi:PKD repeat protein
MNKKENMKKILSSCIVISMVLTAFGTMLLTQSPRILAEEIQSSEPLIRIYGEDNAVYPTQSYYGPDDFIYPMEYDPFDPGIIEKDSITFNPAFIDGHGGEYEIKAQGDASEKVFLRAFYEPGYTHDVDALMDSWSNVNLLPVEVFDAIVTETTYHLLTLYDRDPTVGYPGETKMMLPYLSADPTIPGMEEAALLDVVYTYDGGTEQLTDGMIYVEKVYQFDNIDYSQDIYLSFMDHKVRIYNYENGDDMTLDKLDLDVSYIGNMNEEIASTDTHTIWEDSWGPGYIYYFDRENRKQVWTDPAYRWYLCIENADDDYLRIALGRVLAAGETFYVDGVRYDMPAIYVDGDGGFKYITFQSPIPKCPIIWDMPLSENVDDFSHVTSQYLANLPEFTAMWLLPPFNENHWMVDDIGLFKSSCVDVPLNGVLLSDEKDPLEFYYVDETIEERFDSSLTERLKTDEQGMEDWEWYNVYTKPNQYTEFVLPDQETDMESDGNEYLITTSYIAPNSEVDTDRDDICKSYDEHEIFDRVREIALDNERAQYYEMPRFVYEYDASNPIDFYINEGTNEPSVRIYGEPYFKYPTQSYTDADDFIYELEYYPFDPGVILKDSITFNSAFIDGHGGEYEIKAQGDASEKIFLRAFYEPQYGHDVDALMDAWSDVTLYPVETFDAIVTETTYHLVTLNERAPTVGYPDETMVALPYASLDTAIPGMEELALLEVVDTYHGGTRQYTDGSIMVEKQYEFFDDSYIGTPLPFMDHTITVVNFENADYFSYDKLDIQVSYNGNMNEAIASTDTHTIWEDSWGMNYNFYFDRENKIQMITDPAHRWYLRVENADEDYLRITLGRNLTAGETFYVDGVRYDMPAIYVDGNGGFKYITFQSPIPKCPVIWDMPLSKNVDDFSHVTSQYLANLPEGVGMWFLPPFNDDHWMIDDIDLYKYDFGCLEVPIAGLLLLDEKDPLDFYYIDETIEERFDTSLTERLKTHEEGDEYWQWYNVYTKPNQYTEFVLENQEIPNEFYVVEDYPSWYPTYITADGNEYLITSSLIAPNSNLDDERWDTCKDFDEHEIFSKLAANGDGGSMSQYTQLAMILDGSGSIFPTSWTVMKNGLADAIRNNLPHDGSVELTVIQFSNSATVEVGPVVVDNSNYESIATTIEGMIQMSGSTYLNSGLDLATTTLATNAASYPRQLVNIVTDGYPTDATAAVNARNNMISTLGFVAGEDEIDAEAVGGADIIWLRDSIVWPQPGYDTWPPAGPGWVRYVATFQEFSDTVAEKFGLIFGEIHPRYAFEFDAYDGTGFFINENGISPVYGPPVADAGGPYSGNVETMINFDGSGSYDTDEGGASIVHYDWYFGDGATGTGMTTTHAYISPGTYTVTLEVYDDEGQMDSDTAQVTITSGGGEPPVNGEIIQMSDVSIDEGTDYGYLTAMNVDDDICSAEITLSWDPTVVNVLNVDGSDFETIYPYIDNTAGTMNLIAVNTMITLTGGFTIGRIEFEVVGSYGDTTDLIIGTGLLFTCEAIPTTIYPTLDHGLLVIGDLPQPTGTGDMNGDGNVNAADVTYLAKHLVGDPLYAILHDDGDVNNDGFVNSGDVRYLAMFLVGDPAYTPLYP